MLDTLITFEEFKKAIASMTSQLSL